MHQPQGGKAVLCRVFRAPCDEGCDYSEYSGARPNTAEYASLLEPSLDYPWTRVLLLETETIGRSPSALRLLCSGVAMKPRKGERPPPPLLQAAKTRSNRRTSRLRLAPA